MKLPTKTKQPLHRLATQKYRRSICHTLIQKVDEEFREQFTKFGVTSILDVLKLVCQDDSAFRAQFYQEFKIPGHFEIERPLSLLESLLLKDESVISLGIYDKIQKTISHASGLINLF